MKITKTDFLDKFWEIGGGLGCGDIADTNQRQMGAIQYRKLIWQLQGNHYLGDGFTVKFIFSFGVTQLKCIFVLRWKYFQYST